MTVRPCSPNCGWKIARPTATYCCEHFNVGEMGSPHISMAILRAWSGTAGIDAILAFRDPFGVRPLYVKRSATGIVIASDPEPIGKVAGFGTGVDTERIVEHLLGWYESVDRTFWSDIARVPGGHLLFGPPNAPIIRRYWFPDVRPVRFSGEQQAMDALASCFKQSVERRLDKNGPVFAHLSGGLDSSLVVCVASEIDGGTEGTGRTIRALSERFPGMSTDEGQFIRAVVEWTRVESIEWDGPVGAYLGPRTAKSCGAGHGLVQVEREQR